MCKTKFIMLSACYLLSQAAGQTENIEASFGLGGSGNLINFAKILTTPLVESNQISPPNLVTIGTGKALNALCNRSAYEHLDGIFSPIQIRPIDIQVCSHRHVKDIIELEIGFGSLVVLNHASQKEFSVTRKELYQAMAQYRINEEGQTVLNTFKNWNEINPNLPNRSIKIFGPAKDSGVSEAVIRIVMNHGCHEIQELNVIKIKNPKEYKKICTTFRDDGVFIEQTPSFDATLKQLQDNPELIGITPHALVEIGKGSVIPLNIEGIEPNFDNVRNKTYPMRLPLYIYIKKDSLNTNNAFKLFVNTLMSNEGLTSEISQKFLIPLLDKDIKKNQEILATQTTIF